MPVAEDSLIVKSMVDLEVSAKGKWGRDQTLFPIAYKMA